MWKRTMILLLALVLLATATAGAEGLKTRAFEPKSENDTIWGKTVEPEFVNMRDPALSQDDRLIGLAADGVHALVNVRDRMACLVDVDTGEVTALTPGAPWVEERIRQALAGMDIEVDLTGRELLEAYFSGLAERSRLQFSFNPGSVFQGDGNTLIVGDANGALWTIDCDTGKAYGPMPGQMSCYEGRGLYVTGERQAASIDLESGEEHRWDLSGSADFPYEVSVVAVRFLADGSAAAVVRDAKLDMTEGEACALAVTRPEGETRFYSLQKFKLGWEPDVILPLAGDWVLVYNRMSIMRNMPLAVNLETGEVFALYSPEGAEEPELLTAPVETCLNDVGWPTLPEGCVSLMPLAILKDGDGCLLYHLGSGAMTLYAPHSDQKQLVRSPDGTVMTVPIMDVANMTGNGVDRFALVSIQGRQYLQLRLR